MKIEYRTAGAGGYLTLADTAATTLDVISGYKPSMAKQPQQENLFLAAVPFTADLGNARWSLSFQADRQHASASAAQTFLATHAAALAVTMAPGKLFDLRVTLDDGTTKVYLAAAALAGFDPDPHSDQSTIVRYSFSGGSYQNTAP